MERLNQIHARIKMEQEKLYYLNSQQDPGLQLRFILNTIEALVILENQELSRLQK